MRVEAIATGYYEHRRWKTGQRFFLKDESHFSAQWMKSLESEAPKPAPKAKAKTAKDKDAN
jgi:hypothetical protein